MSAGRPQNILRPVKLTTYLPEDIRAQLDIHLFSTVEGRVPHGAYSKFLAERVREFFEPKQIDKGLLLEVMQWTAAADLHGRPRTMQDVDNFLEYRNVNHHRS